MSVGTKLLSSCLSLQDAYINAKWEKIATMPIFFLIVLLKVVSLQRQIRVFVLNLLKSCNHAMLSRMRGGSDDRDLARAFICSQTNFFIIISGTGSPNVIQHFHYIRKVSSLCLQVDKTVASYVSCDVPKVSKYQ